MTDWNALFVRVRMSHRMGHADVVEACRLGGLVVSRSKAEGWARRDERRHQRMGEQDFEAFTRGLVGWARAAYAEAPDDSAR